jgi:hypothetical protein
LGSPILYKKEYKYKTGLNVEPSSLWLKLRSRCFDPSWESFAKCPLIPQLITKTRRRKNTVMKIVY